jgi:hypothetical protein
VVTSAARRNASSPGSSSSSAVSRRRRVPGGDQHRQRPSTSQRQNHLLGICPHPEVVYPGGNNVDDSLLRLATRPSLPVARAARRFSILYARTITPPRVRCLSTPCIEPGRRDEPVRANVSAGVPRGGAMTFATASGADGAHGRGAARCCRAGRPDGVSTLRRDHTRTIRSSTAAGATRISRSATRCDPGTDRLHVGSRTSLTDLESPALNVDGASFHSSSCRHPADL